MRVSNLKIINFRGVEKADLFFSGHTLLIGGNNVGKSTVCEALDLVLGPDRLNRNPPVEEFDFRNARYLGEDGQATLPIRIEAVLTDLTDEVQRQCAANLEFWKSDERRLLEEGEVDLTDESGVEPCLRLITIAQYDPEEDTFVAKTIYGRQIEGIEEEAKPIPRAVKRCIGFLYLRALRTGSRALSLERGSLLDIILRMKEVRTGLWEQVRKRLAELDPPIDANVGELGPVLDEIEARLGEYVSTSGQDRSTRLFVSQLTREHLRKTVSFFVSMCKGEAPIPFQGVGTGTLNILVLALLTFIAEIKKDNVIFAMEEPEIALPPHTQRRIVNYLMTKTTQCFITSHSPYVIECFEPDGIVRLSRDEEGSLTGIPITLPAAMKAKAYRSQLRRSIAEAMLGQGAIVVEGVTDQLALRATAAKMEEADREFFPLDLAGVTIINTEGDGNLAVMGSFFKALGIPALVLFDKKGRTPDQVTNIISAFDSATEIPYKGAEALLAAEIPVSRQWEFLEIIRAEDTDGCFGIPGVRPDDTTLNNLTLSTLKGLKGEGGAARLIELCSVDELPKTIVEFLNGVFQRFTRPGSTPPVVRTTAGTEDQVGSPAEAAVAAADQAFPRESESTT
jgi:putative ATP-dependent endonuclease of the OLD family